MNGVISQFRAVALDYGILVPASPVIGRLTRCGTRDKENSKDGSYLLFLDGLPAGGFQNHRDGEGWRNWHADSGCKLTPAERKAVNARFDAMRKEREAEQSRKYAEAAEHALKIWEAAEPASSDHQYLQRKQIPPHGIRERYGKLVVPVYSADGKLRSIQFIPPNPNERKNFLTGSKVTGGFFIIGNPEESKTICLAEGFATAVSIFESTGYATFISFSCNNLKAVAVFLRGKYPDKRLVICGDNDPAGVKCAKEVASAVGALSIFPPSIEGVSDFNDFQQREGGDSIKSLIDNAAAQAEPEPITAEQVTARIAELAAMTPIEYELLRKIEAKRMGLRPTILEKEVAKLRNEGTVPNGGLLFDEIEPWPQPVNGDALITEIVSTIKRFIVCDDEVAHAAALWIISTWFIDVIQVAPMALITAPEKRCGKSQLLSIIGRLACRPLMASNISPSAVFRVIEKYYPTLLLDEADTFLSDNEELRGVLNSGHTREGAFTIRNVGDNYEPTRFSTWGFKALAGIGRQADTLEDRSIKFELRRKKPGETVEKLRHADGFNDLTSKLARFAEDNSEAVRRARPSLPPELNDRAQDNWESLIAIADIAGGHWPKLARAAALKISGDDSDTDSIGNELLVDIKTVFTENPDITTYGLSVLLEKLCADEEMPWKTYNRGNPMSARQLSKKLASYDIKLQTKRINSRKTEKQYSTEQFHDVFERYISRTPPEISVTGNISAQHQSLQQLNENTFGNVTVTSALSVTSATNVTKKGQCYGNRNHLVTAQSDEITRLTEKCYPLPKFQGTSECIYSDKIVTGEI